MSTPHQRPLRTHRAMSSGLGNGRLVVTIFGLRGAYVSMASRSGSLSAGGTDDNDGDGGADRVATAPGRGCHGPESPPPAIVSYRIGIGGISIESSTFSPLPSTADDFLVLR